MKPFTFITILLLGGIPCAFSQSLTLQEAKAGLGARIGVRFSRLGPTFVQEISYAKSWHALDIKSLRLVISGGFNFWSKAKEGLQFRDISTFTRVRCPIYQFGQGPYLYGGIGLSLHMLRITPLPENPYHLDRVFILKRGLDLLTGFAFPIPRQWYLQAETRVEILRKLRGLGLYISILWVVPKEFSLRKQFKEWVSK